MDAWASSADDRCRSERRRIRRRAPKRALQLQGGLDVRRRRARIAWRGEVGSIVGEDGVDLIRDSGDQAAQEVPGGAARHLLMQFDEGELRRSVDGDDEVELALRGSNLGEVDMKLERVFS